VPGLDPEQTAKEDFAASADETHRLVMAYNYLEPVPFPYKVVAFSPGLFNLNDIPDPIDFSGRGVHLG
jgi:hypothetical protein